MFFNVFKDADFRKAMGNLALVGTHLASSIIVGLVIGFYLDKWLDTKPWFIIIFLFAGIAAGFKNLYIEAKKVKDEDDKSNRPQD